MSTVFRLYTLYIIYLTLKFNFHEKEPTVIKYFVIQYYYIRTSFGQNVIVHQVKMRIIKFSNKVQNKRDTF
jgi:hypothetical protein